jgi:lysophospholipase
MSDIKNLQTIIKNILSEPRFQKPNGLTFHSFTAKTGEHIRYGYCSATASKNLVLILPGFIEPSEKYFEVISALNKSGQSAAVLDWPCQGQSSRYLKNTHKRHSMGFDQELGILHELITTHLPQDNQRLCLLGHSMGGHLAIRYVEEYGDKHVHKLLVSAPMIDIRIEPPILKIIAPIIATIAHHIGCGSFYTFGDSDWYLEKEKEPLSHDNVRSHLHRALLVQDPSLISAGPTFSWLHHALRSCKKLAKAADKITCPTLILGAGEDIIVNTNATRDFAQKVPHVTYTEIKDAYHEILIESDVYRDQAMKEITTFLSD